jgi:hypothetical protein
MRTQCKLPRVSRAALLLLAFVPVACGRAEGDQQAAEAVSGLSETEIRLARHVAEQRLSPPANPLDRIYYIKVDLLPVAFADSPERRVNVIHYRYYGDETVITTVDLHNLDVLRVVTHRHMPTALAAEEVARAERLARADERTQGLFSGKVTIEARPVHAASADDPFFGRRVIHLLLRDGAHYRTEPHILVDLNHDVVLIDESLSR